MTEILIVAKWWELDPDIVSKWPMPKFSDRQEFMFVQTDFTNRANAVPKPGDELTLRAGETEYRGRPTDG